MTSFSVFAFDSYVFNEQQKLLTLKYSIDDDYHFTEEYRFDFDFADYDQKVLDRTLRTLFFVAGVSYYKTFIPENIEIHAGVLDTRLATFLKNTYQKGLGEFWYVNNLDPKTEIHFQENNTDTSPLRHDGNGLLVAIGGGKDSLVSLELLSKSGLDIATWSLNHRTQLEPLVATAGFKHYFVDRVWDPQLKTLQDHPDSYNGHVPISAIFAAVGCVVAVLAGKRDVVMSNESSADEPTLTYQGVEINHQYSKSSEFEQDFQALLSVYFADSIRYYSLLRSMNEIQIAKEFVESGAFHKYLDVFCSCNRAFMHGKTTMSWDGTCAKCAFVYLALSPFCSEKDLIRVFGRNVLTAEDMKPIYDELLGITESKPLECVGTVEESRWAMDHMKQKYSALECYNYPEITTQNIRERRVPSNIPPDISRVLSREPR